MAPGQAASLRRPRRAVANIDQQCASQQPARGSADRDAPVAAPHDWQPCDAKAADAAADIDAERRSTDPLPSHSTSAAVIQRRVGFEFETADIATER